MSDPRPRPASRPASRRASRPAGTVGGDESLLRSRAPAQAPAPAAPSPVGRPAEAVPGRAAAASGPVVEDLLRAVRSADDADVGWGERPGDDDEHLRREVPPHW